MTSSSGSSVTLTEQEVTQTKKLGGLVFNSGHGNQKEGTSMKVNAIYTVTEHEDGRITHGIDHDGGGFVVSSKEVGVAIQNFLQYATLTDIDILHKHLFHEYARRKNEDNVIDISFKYTSEADITAMSKRGFNDGENAASWLIDGNTVAPYAALTRLIQGMEDGDPEIMDSLPHPRVGGEFADDPTWEQICQDEVEHYGDDGESELFAVYTEAFHEGVEAQIRKMHREYGPSRKS